MIAGLSYVFSQLVNVHSMVFLHHLILKEAFTSVQKENSKLQSLHLVVLLSLALVTNGQQTSDRALQPPIFPCPNVGRPNASPRLQLRPHQSLEQGTTTGALGTAGALLLDST